MMDISALRRIGARHDSAHKRAVGGFRRRLARVGFHGRIGNVSRRARVTPDAYLPIIFITINTTTASPKPPPKSHTKKPPPNALMASMLEISIIM
jgi:hypothetical protein